MFLCLQWAFAASLPLVCVLVAARRATVQKFSADICRQLSRLRTKRNDTKQKKKNGISHNPNSWNKKTVCSTSPAGVRFRASILSHTKSSRSDECERRGCWTLPAAGQTLLFVSYQPAHLPPSSSSLCRRAQTPALLPTPPLSSSFHVYSLRDLTGATEHTHTHIHQQLVYHPSWNDSFFLLLLSQPPPSFLFSLHAR